MHLATNGIRSLPSFSNALTFAMMFARICSRAGPIAGRQVPGFATLGSVRELEIQVLAAVKVAETHAVHVVQRRIRVVRGLGAGLGEPFGVTLALLSVHGLLDLDERICRKLTCSLGQISEVGLRSWGLVSLQRWWVRNDQTSGLRTGPGLAVWPSPQGHISTAKALRVGVPYLRPDAMVRQSPSALAPLSSNRVTAGAELDIV